MSTSSSGLYHDSHSDPIFRRSIVAYLDELGTKQRVPTMTVPDLRQDVSTLHAIYQQLKDEIEKIDPQATNILSFSDNFVLLTPIDVQPTVSYLSIFPVIKAVANYQRNMALNGRFYRGGITVGDAYADSTLATGPAVINAVMLEEGLAVNPRVVLDETALDLVRDEYFGSGYNDGEAWPYQDVLLVDIDQQVFINYLNDATHDELSLHREVLQNKLKDHSHERYVTKYYWAVFYHNYVCRHLAKRPDFVINPVAFKPLTISTMAET